MKRLFIYAALVCNLIAACQNANTARSGDSDDNNEQEAKKKISKRDYSITKENSYSDLFFDSTAMEKFIVSNKVADSIARRMRSFYNTRNYQFAWFSKDGLTEQALGFWNLHDYVTTYDNDTLLRDKALQKRMDALVATEDLSVSAGNKSFKWSKTTSGSLSVMASP